VYCAGLLRLLVPALGACRDRDVVGDLHGIPARWRL